MQQCHDRQQNMPVVQTVFQVEDLPSLIELEDTIRQTQPERSTGLDPLPSGLFKQHAVDLAKLISLHLEAMCLAK